MELVLHLGCDPMVRCALGLDGRFYFVVSLCVLGENEVLLWTWPISFWLKNFYIVAHTVLVGGAP